MCYTTDIGGVSDNELTQDSGTNPALQGILIAIQIHRIHALASA